MDTQVLDASVVTMAKMSIITDQGEIDAKQSPKGKPFIRVEFVGDDVSYVIDITANLAEMIGGAGSGLNARMLTDSIFMERK